MGRGGRVIPFRRKRRKWTSASDFRTGPRFPKSKQDGWGRAFRQMWPFLAAIALLTVGTVGYIAGVQPPSFLRSAPQVTVTDREAASFGYCNGPIRINCVVDGDTFWYHGEKIRIADINTPEVSEPQCEREAALGEKATNRLYELLNAGPFTLETIDRDRDQYGRLLRVLTRDGASLGDTLVSEGLAEQWQGYRGSWC